MPVALAGKSAGGYVALLGSRVSGSDWRSECPDLSSGWARFIRGDRKRAGRRPPNPATKGSDVAVPGPCHEPCYPARSMSYPYLKFTKGW